MRPDDSTEASLKRIGINARDEPMISTPELLARLADPGVSAARFVSVRRGWARVEIVTPERSYFVTAVDPELEPPPRGD